MDQLTKIRQAYIGTMAMTARTLGHLLAPVSQEQATTLRDGPEGWTTVEVVCHLRDFDGFFRGRAEMILAEETPNLPAYDHEAIDASARKIVETVTRTGARVVGPVPLPTEKNVYCVIRSPHKYKDSREHFEMRTHKRLIDILDPTPKTVDALMRIDLPASVDVNIQ